MKSSLIPGLVTTVYTSAVIKPGNCYVDENGKEYIFALGVTNCAIGSWVAFSLETTNNTPITALLTHAIGDYGVSVGVAMAAIDGSSYGWFQIYGAAEGLGKTLNAADAIQYTTSAAGVLDDTSTTQTLIHGVRLADTIGGAQALASYFISYPRTKA